MDACGKNIICRIEVWVETITAQLLSLFDTIIDNWVVIALFLLTLFVLWRGYQKIREGISYQDLAKWLWNRFISVAIVLILGAGILLGLVFVFPDLFGRAGDIVKSFLGL